MKDLYCWLTDTHLNNLPIWKKYKFFTNLKKENPKGIFLTGDISEWPWLSFDLKWFAKLGVPIYYVAGNHERLYSGFEKTAIKIRKICTKYPNFIWLDEQEEPIKLDDEIAIIGADGWFDAAQGNPKWLNLKYDWWLIKEFRQLKSFEKKLNL